MTLLVSVTGWATEPWLARFRRFLPGRRIVVPGDDVAADEILYAATWKHPAGSLAGLPSLKAVFSLGAGVDHLFADAALPDVPVSRVVDPDLTARMSEYVVMHCLMHLRGGWLYAARQRAGLWQDNRDQPAAGDVRVGVLGFGVLGRDAARKLAVMGFDVAAWSRSGGAADGIACFAGEAELGAFLARTDILVSLLPLTEETRGILSRPLFERLARDGRLGAPILVNAGRGGLQREVDILSSLDDGILGAATLDVFETEPLPISSAFWRHPAVTVTPHNSATSDPDAVGRAVADAIGRFEAGEPLSNRVDRRRGY